MELHQSMYKMNRGALTPNRAHQTKREEVNANRLKHRQDMYSRRISVSPLPNREARISATSTPAAELRAAVDSFKATLTATQMDFDMDDKENQTIRQPQQQQPSPNAVDKSAYASRIVVKPSGSRATEKMARQEAYLMRFIEWKEQQRKKKEATAQQKKQQVRPFVPVATGGSTFMPPRSQQFRAPEGLKNPATEGPMAIKSTKTLRKSFYTPVPTPPRKEKPEPIVKKKIPISQLAATHRPIVARKPAAAPVRAPSVNRDAAITSKAIATTLQPRKAITKTAPKPPKTETKTAAKVETFARKPPAITITKPTSTLTTLKTSIPPRTRTISTEPKPAASASAKITKKTSPILARNRSRQLMPPPAVKTAARVVKPLRGGGGVAKTDSNIAGSGATKKAKMLQSNKAGVVTTSKPAKLSVSMKAKKPVAPLSRIGSQGANEMKRQYAKNLLGLPVTSFSALETPTELEGKNPFNPKVTSTNFKALPTDFEALLETTPGRAKSEVAEERKLSGTMRELLLKEEPVQPTKARFNFVRYSEANTEVDIKDVSEAQPQEEVELDGVKKLEETREDNMNEEKPQPQQPTEYNDEAFESPKRQDVPERPINYLSPFVSVSRGKVNARAEKIKRNSIYLVDGDAAASETATADKTPPRAAAATPPQRPTTPVETRRTLEAVLYFRKQLSDTIDRLHELCDQWNAYREENTARLQETNGEDMINVTIGQTKLLTSKKFMQFKGLIDRCEAQARGEGPPDDGSEKTKLITSVDLEGFWVMLGIQVDNLDQRFENLQRWKANDWNDPDEVAAAAAAKPAKVKKNLTKVKKPKEASAATKKAKPNSALLQMMRKMHAEMRKNKAPGQDEEAEIMVAGGEEKPATPKRNSISEQPSTPSSSRRYSYILVRDRKSFSKAPTVLKVPTPQRESLTERTSEERGLLRATLLGNEKKRRLSSAMAGSPRVASFGQPEQSEECTPVRPKSRKSILKTPGTAKSHRKSVVFANRVKQFKFTVKDGSDDDDKSDNEEQRKNANSEVELKRCHGDEEAHGDGPDGSSRMYSLRTRKVALRPSCEIVIPK